MTKSAALHSFFGSFSLTAYEENSVPDNAAFPYITYPVQTSSFGEQIPLTFSLWYRSDSWVDINAKAEEISEKISRGGYSVEYDNGSIYIQRDSPFSNSMGDTSDDKVKRKLINIIVEYISLN